MKYIISVVLTFLLFGGMVCATSADRIIEETSLGISWLSILTAIIVVLVIWDQYTYRIQKGKLPGPQWRIPFIGELYASMNPKFSDYLEQWKNGPLVCTKVFNKFIVLATDTEISRKIFNTPGSIVPCVIPSMKEILTPRNFVFLQGEGHYLFRKGLNPLFTRSAIALYTPIIEKLAKEHMSQWVEKASSSAQPFYPWARDFTIRTSVTVFCGHHIPQEDISEISGSYYHLTRALQLVNFPWALPGTKVWNAIQARKRIVEIFTSCVERSIKYIEEGNAPTCLIDKWIFNQKQETLKNINSEETSLKFSVEDMSLTLLSFLFASQDALTSSIIWLTAALEAHPQVLERVREEFSREGWSSLTPDTLSRIPFAFQVVKESLRYRPPVIMVPQEARRDVALGSHTIPEGTIVIPTIWPAAHDPKAFPNPDTFDPDRFGPERQEDIKSPQNYLVFGHGPHKCIAKDYAYVILVTYMANLSMRCNWKRTRTPESEEIKIIATIFPQDDCLLTFTPRDNLTAETSE